MLNFLEELFLYLNQSKNRGTFWLASNVAGIIFFISLIFLILELHWIFTLLTLLKFILIFNLVGVVFGIFFYLILVKIGAVTPSLNSFWKLLISGILLILSLSSKINRTELPKQANELVLVVDQPKLGKTISRIPISIDGQYFELRAQIEKGNLYKKGDKIPIIKYRGLLGFELIVDVKNV